MQGGQKGSANCANCAGVCYHSPSVSCALSIPSTSFHKLTISITSCFCKRSSKLAEFHNDSRAAGTSYHHVRGENPCRWGAQGEARPAALQHVFLFVCLHPPSASHTNLSQEPACTVLEASWLLEITWASRLGAAANLPAILTRSDLISTLSECKTCLSSNTTQLICEINLGSINLLLIMVWL